ncbi:IMPACT family protein [Pedobacter sp. BS3]|uniref:IMPACT family protein n=1 Tax=Pedobacter sp. BS3 TaxID=2567937 RepID=UPI00165A0B04|nr:YigZ family protein [Pedobacter sp. BS3]
MFDNSYKTIAKPSEGLFKDKGSKFIAYAFPVATEQEARQKLDAVKAEHPKARHHCWAYRLTPDRSVFRINDDGEPSGTAGRPILNTLLSADVTNIMLIVVRYFGGTLLGVPGLINAYKTAAADALKQAQIIEKPITDIYRLEFAYLYMNDVMRIVKEGNLPILKQQFDNTCTIELAVPKLQVNAVVDKLEHIENIQLTYLYTS